MQVQSLEHGPHTYRTAGSSLGSAITWSRSQRLTRQLWSGAPERGLWHTGHVPLSWRTSGSSHSPCLFLPLHLDMVFMCSRHSSPHPFSQEAQHLWQALGTSYFSFKSHLRHQSLHYCVRHLSCGLPGVLGYITANATLCPLSIHPNWELLVARTLSSSLSLSFQHRAQSRGSFISCKFNGQIQLGLNFTHTHAKKIKKKIWELFLRLFLKKKKKTPPFSM